MINQVRRSRVVSLSNNINKYQQLVFDRETVHRMFTNQIGNKVLHQQAQDASSTNAAGQDISKCPYHQQPQQPPQVIKSFDEIPGPKGLPLVGNLFHIMKGVKKNASPYFASLCEEYGEIVKLDVVGKKMLFLGNPTDMEYLYKHEERRNVVDPSRKFKLERGLPLTPIEMYLHEPWNETRQLYNIAMKPDFQTQVTLPQLTEINGEYIRRIIKYLEETDNPEKFRLVDGVGAVSRYGFDAVLKVFLGAKLTDDVTKTFPFDVADFVKVSTEFLDDPLRLISKPSLYKYFKTAEYKQMEQAMEKSLSYANYVMDRFKNNPSDKPRFYETLMERSKDEPNQIALVQSVMITFLQAAIDITMR
ncbi:predicted protein [Naegleria gruberi]|uniref:Predicted protein n=1 Tax=Naegleria gruberi TaxID=5762 RepID=D2VER3_NAEGR|nr:uncharacterized protein NAEGRDRAFT_67364 [Naegleria gruberi]EFC44551.1 predicted protein [Naegleria gruberi]|eukprot:XP_002677295.1 predicted protein [Naegleria gruberi strain NEG-M]